MRKHVAICLQRLVSQPFCILSPLLSYVPSFTSVWHNLIHTDDHPFPLQWSNYDCHFSLSCSFSLSFPRRPHSRTHNDSGICTPAHRLLSFRWQDSPVFLYDIITDQSNHNPHQLISPWEILMWFWKCNLHSCLLIGIFKSSDGHVLRWMPQDLTDDKSTLV